MKDSDIWNAVYLLIAVFFLTSLRMKEAIENPPEHNTMCSYGVILCLEQKCGTSFTLFGSNINPSVP